MPMTIPPEAIPPIVAALQLWGFPSLFMMLVVWLFGRPLIQRAFKKLDADEAAQKAHAAALENLARSGEGTSRAMGEMTAAMTRLGIRIEETHAEQSHERAETVDTLGEILSVATAARDAATAARDAADRILSRVNGWDVRTIPHSPDPQVGRPITLGGPTP